MRIKCKIEPGIFNRERTCTITLANGTQKQLFTDITNLSIKENTINVLFANSENELITVILPDATYAVINKGIVCG